MEDVAEGGQEEEVVRRAMPEVSGWKSIERRQDLCFLDSAAGFTPSAYYMHHDRRLLSSPAVVTRQERKDQKTARIR
jgi:hypothetical protein